MVPAPNEEAADTAYSKTDLLSMMKIVMGMMDDMEQKINKMDNIIDNIVQASEHVTLRPCV